MFAKPLFLTRATIIAAAISVTSIAANASFITMSPDPFLGSNVVLSTGGVALGTPGVGYADTFTIDNFGNEGFMQSGSDELLTYTADFEVTFYTDATLTTVSTTGTLMGNFDATISGRTSPFQLGTFPMTITLATFNGTVGGKSVMTTLDPGHIDTGSVGIVAGPGVGQYTISSSTLVYAQQFIDGVQGPAVPPLSATTQTPAPVVTPEPTSLAIFGLGLAGLFALRRRMV